MSGGVRGQGVTAGDVAQNDAALPLGQCGVERVERTVDLGLGRVARLGEIRRRHGLGREEQQRLDGSLQGRHPASTVIGPKVSF